MTVDAKGIQAQMITADTAVAAAQTRAAAGNIFGHAASFCLRAVGPRKNGLLSSARKQPHGSSRRRRR